MTDTWWMPADGPEGELWEVSADGTQLRIDGYVFELADATVDEFGVATAAWEPAPGGGWS